MEGTADSCNLRGTFGTHASRFVVRCASDRPAANVRTSSMKECPHTWRITRTSNFLVAELAVVVRSIYNVSDCKVDKREGLIRLTVDVTTHTRAHTHTRTLASDPDIVPNIYVLYYEATWNVYEECRRTFGTLVKTEDPVMYNYIQQLHNIWCSVNLLFPYSNNLTLLTFGPVDSRNRNYLNYWAMHPVARVSIKYWDNLRKQQSIFWC
jgi:hypothetical protein